MTPPFTAGHLHRGGQPHGAAGHSANGTAATSALLNEPNSVEAFNGSSCTSRITVTTGSRNWPASAYRVGDR